MMLLAAEMLTGGAAVLNWGWGASSEGEGGKVNLMAASRVGICCSCCCDAGADEDLGELCAPAAAARISMGVCYQKRNSAFISRCRVESM